VRHVRVVHEDIYDLHPIKALLEHTLNALFCCSANESACTTSPSEKHPDTSRVVIGRDQRHCTAVHRDSLLNHR
jgi:hypothetical protein